MVAVYIWKGPNAKAYNNIIWNNLKSDSSVANVATYNSGSYGNFINNCTTPLTAFSSENGNFDGDPKILVDRLHIGEDSSCKGTARTGTDAAGVSYVAASDFSGVLRGNLPCVGAMEYVKVKLPMTVLAPVPAVKRVHYPGTIAFTCTVEGDYTEPLAYYWNFDGEGKVTADTASVDLDVPGTYHNPTITVTDKDGQVALATVEGAFTVIQLQDKSYFVDYVGGNDANDGETSGTSWKTLAHAVASAKEGNTLVLARGTHMLNADVTIDKILTITGEGECGETILDDNQGRYINVAVDDVLIRNLTFYRLNNSAFRMNSDSVVSNVVFTGETGSEKIVEAANGLFTSCLFTNNVKAKVAGIYLSGPATVENCVFRDNRTASSSGGNPAGVLCLDDDSVVIRNCTVIDNTIYNYGGAIFFWKGRNAKVYNNIVWNNVRASDSSVANHANYSGTAYGNFVNNCTTPLSGLSAENVNFDGDPKILVDRLHIGEDSSCKGTARTGTDAAGVSYVSASDFSGVLRGDSPCVGALEYVKVKLPMTVLAPVPAVKRVHYPGMITFACTVGGDYTEPLAYYWNFDGEGKVTGNTESVDLATPGTYRNPTITVTDKDGQESSATVEGTFTVIRLVDKSYYVDYVNGKDENDGETSGTAWKTLAHAVASAGEGNTLVLARGTHMLNADVAVDKILTITGEGEKGETILDGNQGRYLNVAVDEALVKNLTFYRLNNDGFRMNGDSAVSNVVFTGVAGGVNGVTAAKGVFTSCLFTNNVSAKVAGIYLSGPVTVENCVFTGNRTASSSGGNPTGVLCIYDNRVVVRNCTIIDNTISFGGAVYLRYCTTMSVCNNIIWNNVKASDGTAANFDDYGNSKFVGFVSNCTTPLSSLPAANRNIGAAPIFTDGDPFAPAYESPCRNAGNDDLAPKGVDFFGNPRKVSRHVDIGAVEDQKRMGFGILVR